MKREKQLVYASLNSRIIANIIDISVLFFFLYPVGRMLDFIFNNDASSVLRPVIIDAAEKFKNSSQFSEVVSYILHDSRTYKYYIIDHHLISMILCNLFIILLGSTLLCLCWKNWGTSVGKLLLGLKIVDQDSLQKIELKKSINRMFWALIFFAPITLFSCKFSKENQAWHDRLSKTLIIKR